MSGGSTMSAHKGVGVEGSLQNGSGVYRRSYRAGLIYSKNHTEKIWQAV